MMEEDLAVKMPQLSVEMMKFVNSLSIGMDWHHRVAAECYEAMKGDSRGSLLQSFIGTMRHHSISSLETDSDLSRAVAHR
jgi:hypothetical protein